MKSFCQVYHDEGAKSPIDHLQSIEGVPVLHLQDRMYTKNETIPYQTTPGDNGKDGAKDEEKNSCKR